MNIVHPGDHVIIAYGSPFDSTEARENFIAALEGIPDEIRDSISMTFLPIGPKGSASSVLLVIRKP